MLVGDSWDKVIPLGKNTFAIHDDKEGFQIYENPKPESQITTAQWKQIAEAYAQERKNDSR